MCFSPPPGAAVRVPARSAAYESRVQFRGAARYDGVSDSDAGSALGNSLARSEYLDRTARATGNDWKRLETNGNARDSLEYARAPADAGEPEAVPDASWLNSTLPDAPLSPAQTDMEMDVLAALTLDAEADVRAEEEASLVSASRRGTQRRRRGRRDGVPPRPVTAYDHHDAPRIARDAGAERAVLLEAAKSPKGGRGRDARGGGGGGASRAAGDSVTGDATTDGDRVRTARRTERAASALATRLRRATRETYHRSLRSPPPPRTTPWWRLVRTRCPACARCAVRSSGRRSRTCTRFCAARGDAARTTPR